MQVNVHRAAALVGVLVKPEVCFGDLTACGETRETVDMEIAADDPVGVPNVADIEGGVVSGGAVRIAGGNEGRADVVRIFRRLGHRGVEEDGIGTFRVVHPFRVGGHRQKPTAGGFFQLVSGIIRSLIFGVHHVGRGDGVDGFAVRVGQGDAAVVQKLRRQTGDVQAEGISIIVLPRGDDDAFLDAVGVVLIAKRRAVQKIFVFQRRVQLFRLRLCKEGVRDFFLRRCGNGQNLGRNKWFVLGVNCDSGTDRFRLLGFGCRRSNGSFGVFRNFLPCIIRSDCVRSLRLRVVVAFCIQRSICGIISSAHDLDRRLRLDRAFCVRGQHGRDRQGILAL